MRAAVLLFAVTLAFAQTKFPAPVNRIVDFEKDVQPLLEQKCYSCHGEQVQQSGLRLDRRQAALRGGDYGPVIIPGDSAKSKLIRRVVNGDGGLQMPPSGPLSEEEIGILRAWIDQGADFRIEVQAEAPKPVDPKLAALISAIRARDTGAVETAIAADPQLINAKDHAGETPLHHAAGFGNLATMKLLLDKGADPNGRDRRKSTPLFWALYEEPKVRLLLDRGADVNARSVEGRTPLHQAVMMGNATPVVLLLLEKGADPNAKTLNRMTPLIAASRGSVEAMRLLIERGADVNARNGAGATALIAAASTGRPDAVRLLLGKGADVNIRTKRNETALAEAATAGNEEVVRMLLDRGADVNVQDIRGYSALAYAAGADAMSPAIVKMLLAKGADRGAKGDGETVRQLAAKRGDTEVARLLGVTTEERNAERIVLASLDTRERSVATAIGPALSLLEKQSHNFIRIGGCNSCHAQDLPSSAAAIARERGLPAPKEIPQLPQSMHALTPSRIMDLFVVAASGIGWEMFDFATNRVPRDEYTDACVHYLKAMQTAEGNWRTFESRRPPMAAGDYQAAALAIFAMKTYGPPAEKVDTDASIARAVAWLAAAAPATTQDRAFQLMGLAWGHATPVRIRASAEELIANQRGDGGWSQMTTMLSDAYATGQALYALNAAGIRASHPAYAKGVKYLMRTQATDGSWHVRSRSIWVQPYFDSGFPYGTDQWISAAGTAWATMALSVTVEPRPPARHIAASIRRK